MRLSALLHSAGIHAPPLPADGADALDREVTGLSYDSRTLKPGEVFVAISGFHVDGARFIAQAFARGAPAAIMNDTQEAPGGGPCIVVPDTRAALATLAAAWYGRPARRLRTVGVTGTDGKTTTSYLISAALAAGDFSTGLFTTVACKIGPRWEENDSRQTTPEALEVQQLLRRMADAGVDYAVLESTSHGLELHKLDHCEYDIAVFTNLTADHLDFHGTVEAYRAAKGRLFAMLDTAADKGIAKLAVLNADDASAAYMASRTTAACLSYGIEAPADVALAACEPDAAGSRLRVTTPAGELETYLPLPGRFNISNALAAIAVGVSQGVPPARLADALAAATGVPGRMQRIEAGQPFTVVVDYAHTAASFEKVLATLRPLTRGRLIAVFGCAGERGAERRTGMGAVAARHADYAVLTSEDPRAEDPDAIIADIAAAMSAAGAQEGRDFARVTDRRAAIARAFALAAAGDVVLLTGKGHERSIQTAAGKLPWDEAAVARDLLSNGAVTS